MIDAIINDNVTFLENAAPIVLAGRYLIVRKLGEGGMGSVWLAEDTKLDGRKVAIKMLPSILVSNKWAYAQVKAEALVSLKLSHPNIVSVRSFEEENGNPFLVMDYIDGQTLDDYLAEKGKLSEDETVKLLKPIAAALDYAHSQGVVHRDVKPGNVMIAKDGTPYILDFGIAREIQETMTRVTGKLSSGTLMYMSPEQLNGDAPKPAQDVYSFAAMVYECLKGEPPFSRGQIEFQIINNNPEPLADEIVTRSQVMAGLAKTPEKRPATCASVLSVETCISRDLPFHKVPIRKNRLVAVLIGVLLLGVIFGIGGWWWRERVKTDVVAKTEYRGSRPGDTMEIELPGGEKMEFVWCPATTSEVWKRISGGKDYFLMGSPESETDRFSNETQHRVKLTQGFWMGKYEVTQRQWECVMRNNPSSFRGDNLPVENVSWDECQDFIRKINAAGNVKVSLPTEAQWEYACRAGTTTPFNFGSSLNGDKANCDGNYPYGTTAKGKYLEKTAPVGSYAPNAWGLYDMHGNVWEWCQDRYGAYSGDATDPTGPASCADCVFRGGCWYSLAPRCRSSRRYGDEPGYRNGGLGFRLVCFEGPRR